MSTLEQRARRQRQRLAALETERARLAALPEHHRHEEHRNPAYINGSWFCCASVQLGFKTLNECDACGEPWPCDKATQ